MKTTLRTLMFAAVPTIVLLCLVEGAAQIYWCLLKRQALQAVERQGESVIRNDAINFMKIVDPVMGYKLAPSLNITSGDMHVVTTPQGFFQRESVALPRKPKSFRVIVLGDSSVMGHDVDVGNFPTDLRRLLASHVGQYPGGTDVINAGVAGYISDQTALWADAELADYRPDVVVLYAGFNDFQSYPPCEPPAEVSFFEKYYGKTGQFSFLSGLKSVVIVRALIGKFADRKAAVSGDTDVERRRAWVFQQWQGQDGAVVERDSTTSEGALSIALPPGGYAWTAAPGAGAAPKGQYVASLRLKGEGALTLRVNGFQKPWPTYNECPVELTAASRSIECTFTQPTDRMGVEIMLLNTSMARVVVSAQGVNVHTPGEAAKVIESCSVPYPPEQVYAFFIRNLDHTVDSFRRANSGTKVLISTLVGRWPMDTEEQFDRSDGHIWWMKTHHQNRQDAAAALDRFNALIRAYAASRHLILVDMAQVFAGLDRQKLMWSFAHMTNEGYEIIAHTIYDSMLREQLLSGSPPR